MKTIIKLLTLSLIIPIASCSYQSFRFNGTNDNTKLSSLNETSVWLAMHNNINATEICKESSKIAIVVVYRSAFDVFLSLITTGILATHHASIFCTKDED